VQEGLNVCAGGLKAKTLFIYSVSYFNMGGLELFVGAKPTKDPCGEELPARSAIERSEHFKHL